MADITSFAAKRNEEWIESTSRYKIDKEDFCYDVFPDGFKFGCGSAAYQIEGGWDSDGKGPSVWDTLCHKTPELVEDGTNGDVACDSYHKYRDDVQLLKNMGANMYKFSINWPRIFPEGTPAKINQAGVDYYNNLIDNLLENGVQPMVTIYHWDIPQALIEKFTWSNEEMIEPFVQLAQFCFKTFGDRVKYWLTINEPWAHSMAAYDLGFHPPRIHEPDSTPYRVVHNLLKAHALCYRIYEKEFKESQQGKVGISIDSWGFLPADPNSEEDKKAVDVAFQFKFGGVAHPIFYGCYPPAMRSQIDRKSKEEGRENSRLPEFDEEWSAKIKGSVDFIGINHYTCELITSRGNAPANTQLLKWSTGTTSGFDADQEIDRYHHPEWPGSATWWMKVTPWALRPFLNMVKNAYNNPEIIIAENGYPEDITKTEDIDRTAYHTAYLNEILKAVKLDGCNVTGYMAWCLLDAWEWTAGHLLGFGLHHIDFKHPDRTRTQKASAKALSVIYHNKGFPRQK